MEHHVVEYGLVWHWFFISLGLLVTWHWAAKLVVKRSGWFALLRDGSWGWAACGTLIFLSVIASVAALFFAPRTPPWFDPRPR